MESFRNTLDIGSIKLSYNEGYLGHRSPWFKQRGDEGPLLEDHVKFYRAEYLKPLIQT